MSLVSNWKASLQAQIIKKWKIYDVFYILLLEQNTFRKKQVDKKVRLIEFDTSNNNKEYKIETIQDSTIYTKESKSHLPRLYYLVSWKDYFKKKNTWEPYLVIQHLRKLISSFYKDHLKKSIATSKAIDTVSLIARPTIKPSATTKPIKQKQGRLANNSNKRAEKSSGWFLLYFWAFFDVWIIHIFSLQFIYVTVYITSTNQLSKIFYLLIWASSFFSLIFQSFAQYPITYKVSVFLFSPNGLRDFLLTIFYQYFSSNHRLFSLAFYLG